MVSDIHPNKKVPIRYQAWLVVADSSNPNADQPTESSNIWLQSDLASFQTNTRPAAWIAETNYRVPSSGKDCLPATAEHRAMSEVQESAQLLGGRSVPMEIIRSLLKGTDIEKEPQVHSVAIINLTPYEGMLELGVLGLREEMPTLTMRSLSISNEHPYINCSQTTVALRLMQERPSLMQCLNDLLFPT